MAHADIVAKNQPSQQVAALMDAMKESMEVTIADGVRREWRLSNSKNDALVSDLFGEAVERMSDEQRECTHSM